MLIHVKFLFYLENRHNSPVGKRTRSEPVINDEYILQKKRRDMEIQVDAVSALFRAYKVLV